MPENISLFSAFFIGLASGLHCVAMCGGISGALGYVAGKKQPLRVVAYNAGRITSYTVIGFIVGSTGWLLQKDGVLSHIVLQTISGVLLILIGIQVSGFRQMLYYLEKAGFFLWRYLSPLGKTLLPVDNLMKAWMFGFLWGWLPCGLVYSALAWSVSAGSPGKSAVLMAAFGLGTLPWLLLTAIGGQNLAFLMRRPQIKIALALCLMTVGVYTLYSAIVLHSGYAANFTKSIHHH